MEKENALDTSLQKSVKVRERYDRFYEAKDFDHFPWEKEYIRFLGRVISPERRSGKRVLDIGCGTGYYTEIFHSLGFNVCGIDLSNSGLRVARLRDPALQLIVADAMFLPFKDLAFAMVFCHGFSLFNTELTKEAQIYAVDLVRSLEKGGVFVFAFSSNLRGGKRSRNWREHNIQEARQFLADIGLEVEDTYFLERRVILRLLGKRSFSAAVTRTVALVSRVTGFPGLIVCIGRKPSG